MSTNRCKYTEEQLKEAVKSSTSIRQVLLKLGLKPAGGNYASIKGKIAKLSLDDSHFRGQGWLKGRKHSYRKRPLTDFLAGKATIQSYRLKRRLIEEGFKKHQCEECQRTVWNKKPIPLELHHIDGDSNNNSLKNLKLLCSNCHAQTENYRGKAKKK